MTPEIDKLICRECGHHLHSSEQLVAPNPFDEELNCFGCPKCRSIDSFDTACDEPGCWDAASCGNPCKIHRYRSTCHKHQPQK